MTIESNKISIIKEYQIHKSDTGSCEVQIALLTDRIQNLQNHLKTHKKDVHSRRGLLNMIVQRRKLLLYPKKNNISKYNMLVKKLNLRK